MSKFIHHFVINMSMREKAYFKRFAQMYSEKKDKNYIILYEELEQMQEYNHSELKRRFTNLPMGKHLSSELNYLLGQLLKAMLNYHMDSSSKKRLQKSLLFVDILIAKGYPKQALKILDKTKKLAAQSEDFTTILKIIQLREEILFKEGILDFTKMLELLGRERLKVNNQINNLNKLRLIREQIRELQVSTSSNLKHDNYPCFFTDPLLDSEEGILSYRAKAHWLYIKAIKNAIVKEIETSKFYFGKAIEHMEKHPNVFKTAKILPLLSNYLYASAMLKDKDSFMKMLPKLEAFEHIPNLDQSYIFYAKHIRIFELYYQTSEYKACVSLEKEVAKFISTNGSQLEFNQLNYLYFSLSRSYIISSRFEMAMDYLNKWRQYGAFHFFAIHLRLFILITYFELELENLLEAEVASTYKILNRQKKYNDLAKSFIQFFKSNMKVRKNLKAQLKVLSGKLELYSKNSKNVEYMYFNYPKWVNDRIELIA